MHTELLPGLITWDFIRNGKEEQTWCCICRCHRCGDYYCFTCDRLIADDSIGARNFERRFDELRRIKKYGFPRVTRGAARTVRFLRRCQAEGQMFLARSRRCAPAHAKPVQPRPCSIARPY